VALGIGFVALNVIELAFLDGGPPQIVGLVLGLALAALGIARQRGWAGMGR
jgi:hypothetical protein